MAQKPAYRDVLVGLSGAGVKLADGTIVYMGEDRDVSVIVRANGTVTRKSEHICLSMVGRGDYVIRFSTGAFYIID